MNLEGDNRVVRLLLITSISPWTMNELNIELSYTAFCWWSEKKKEILKVSVPFKKGRPMSAALSHSHRLLDQSSHLETAVSD